MLSTFVGLGRFINCQRPDNNSPNIISTVSIGIVWYHFGVI